MKKEFYFYVTEIALWVGTAMEAEEAARWVFDVYVVTPTLRSNSYINVLGAVAFSAIKSTTNIPTASRTPSTKTMLPCRNWLPLPLSVAACHDALHYTPPTMILFIGMWINFTKNPVKPIIRNPMPVAFAIVANSIVGVNRRKEINSKYNTEASAHSKEKVTCTKKDVMDTKRRNYL